MKPLVWLFPATVMVFLASATISRASDCDLLLLNGVFDEHDVFGFDYQKRVFLNRFCSAHYGSLQEAQNDSLNATIPIQGVMVGFGLSGNSSTFKTDYDTLCSQQDAYLKSSRLSSEKIRAANGNLAKEFRKCIVNQTGLSAWLTPTDNKQFQIRAKYRPGSGSAPYDKVDALDYDHAMGNCGHPPDRIGPEGVTINCSRNNATVAFQAALNTKWGNQQFVLPAVLPPVPPPPPPPPIPESQTFNPPIYEGHRLDRCFVPRAQCDLYAATQFCIANKYAVAAGFDIAHGVGQTISMGDSRNPKVPDGVDAFSYIICTNPIRN